MQAFKRSQRVAELLRKEISNIINHELKDPAIGMSTVSAVKLTDDLKFAKIYVSIIGSDEAKNTAMRGLERAKSWIRTELGRRLALKQIPQIDFRYDDTVEYTQRIESLLKQIKK